MRITVDIKGFYDWVPCPPGTQITQEDVTALRVKKMADDKWAMKVTVPSPDPAQVHTIGLHEETIANQLAAGEFGGREISREECVAELLRKSFHHHLHPSHLVKINVQDDGPNKELYLIALEARGITNKEEAVERYLEPVDLEDYLNQFFKTESFRQAHAKAKAAKTKEA